MRSITPIFKTKIAYMKMYYWRHDTQYNGTQHNDIKHYNTVYKGLTSDIHHNNTLSLCLMSLCWVSRFIHCHAECRYAECRGAHGSG